jgi:hypothetical protein
MSEIFNTPFEISLRVLLTLETGKDERKTATRIAAADFITVYGEDFGISEANLHGDNAFRFSEFSLRCQRVELALKELVLDGMVDAFATDDGFEYAISGRGLDYCGAFDNLYAGDYRADAEETQKLISGMTDRGIVGMIHRYSMSALQRSEGDV